MLFCNIDLLDEKFETKRNQYVGVKDGRIAYIGASAPEEDFGERYDGRHRLLMPAFYNVHSHAPMTLLRGYAENLPLQRWLGRGEGIPVRGSDRRRGRLLRHAARHLGDARERHGVVLGYVLFLRRHGPGHPRERHQVQSEPRPDRVRRQRLHRPAGLPRQRAPARRVERREQRPPDR